MNDMNTAVKNWLLQCPEIRADRLYFNYLSVGAEQQAFQIVENTTVREDICGNEIGKYTFALIDFRALSGLPVGQTNIDFARLADATKISEWIATQARTRNYPTVSGGIVIDKITVPPAPLFGGNDRSEGMNLAKYMIQVSIDYTKFI